MRTATTIPTLARALGRLADDGFVGGALDVTWTASAYLDPVWTELTGRCNNSCIGTGEVVEKRTGEGVIRPQSQEARSSDGAFRRVPPTEAHALRRTGVSARASSGD